MARTVASSADFPGLKVLSVIDLHSAVRGVHIYRRYPSEGTKLQLRRDVGSAYKNAVLVQTMNADVVGHLAAEHSKLVGKWIGESDCKVHLY